MAEKIKLVFRLISTLALTFGAIYGYVEYSNSIADTKISRSLEFFREFRSAQILDARKEVHAAIDSVYNDNSISDSAAADIKRIEKFDDAETRTNLSVVLEYFDHLYLCAKKNLCDRSTVVDLLKGEASHLLGLVSPVIARIVTDGSPDYGLGLKCVAHKFTDTECQM